MEREANYTAVGAFVLLVATMAALFVYWYAGSADARDYKRYEIYFEGSVSGLNRGSTVRYLGVEVGRVVAITHRQARLGPRAGDRRHRSPARRSPTTRWRRCPCRASPACCTSTCWRMPIPSAGMEPVPSEQYPVIDSVQSNFDLFLASLPDLVGPPPT